MSYNGSYGNYSPYFQQATGSGERRHDPYQTPANTRGRYPSQVYSSSTQSSPYQPLSAYAPQQQPQQASFAPTASTADRSSASHDRYEDGPTASQYQDSRGDYGYNPRSSKDTAAMGNLGHASTLGGNSRTVAGTREKASLQQIIEYNRSRSSYGYGGSIAYDTAATGYNYSHERSDSRGNAASSDGHARGPLSNQSQTQTHIATQGQPTNYATTATYNNPMPAYSTSSQIVPYTTNSTKSYSAQSTEQIQRSQTGRPVLNGHSSRPSQQGSQSPTQPAYRTNTNPVTSVRSRPRSEQAQARVSPLPNSAKGLTSTSPAPTQENRNYYSALTPSNRHAQQQSSSAPSSTRGQQTSGSDSQTSLSPEDDQTPKTVDPSHVFNQVEYQRRQAAAAAADEARKAADVEETRKATEAAAALKRVSESNQPWSNGTTTSVSSREEEMAAEMRLMIERMRDYKSKDPSLFSQIWEQVKKTQPAGALPAAPPLSARDITVPTSVPNLVQDGQTNGMATADKDGLPDLGKFPAQRRRRGPSVNPAKDTSDSSPRVNSSPANAPETSRASSQSFQTTPNVALTKALNTNRLNTNRYIVYTSGTGPQPKKPFGNDMPTPGPPAVLAPPAVPAPPAVRANHNANWPEHKKWDLALAARNTLLRYPVNSNKDISAEEILGFLNQNPSFEQLCRTIEAKGFILERSRFARSLLDAIPDMEAGLREKHQHGVHYTHPPPINTAQINGVDYGTKTFQPMGVPAHAPTARMTPSQPQPSSTPKTEETAKVPLTKQELARKRTIAEIVDLSQVSDDDNGDLPPPQKIPRIDGPVKPADTRMVPSSRYEHAQGSRPTQTQPFQQPGLPLWNYAPPSFHKPPPLVPSQTSAAPALSLPNLSPQQRELINSEHIVRPIDKRKVRVRTKYDPKTIVRDVLIAVGRHPTMLPLNYHLENLRETFKHVNDLSDLSTFRWDLVDPGEPIVAAVAERRLTDITDGNEADEDVQEVVRTAPQVNLDVAGAATTSVHVLQNLPRLPKLLGPQQESISRQAVTTTESGNSKISSGLSSTRVQAPNEPPTGTPQTASTASTAAAAAASSGSSTVRKRGRPPGTSQKTSTAAAAVSAAGSDNSPTVRKRGRPRKSTGSPTAQSNSMATRPRVDTTPARPSGLRTAISSADGIAVVIPSPARGVVDSKPRRGRPAKAKESYRTSQQTSPVYHVYKCKWKNCPAELHNLETLKKHVFKHGEKYTAEGGPIPCLWKGCGQATQEDEMDVDAQQPLEFATYEIWVEHMDRRHIVDDAWRLGDGPNTRSGSEISDSVSESANCQVTPIIHNDGQARPDLLPLISHGKPAKTYHKAHGITTELGKAKAFMEASEGRRKKFGPGMDRVGVTFVTDKKRALLNDEVAPLKIVQDGIEQNEQDE
ncbi:MAG: hypothetical protein Q9202_002673 [Teloschistes flavicans]